MAMFGSNMSGEVGLRLLLCPLGSNVVTRTACCSVGVALPVYSTFKAIETRDQNEQQKWLLYWAAYGSFSIVEIFTDKFLYWFPLYYQMKFAFLVWLQLPSVEVLYLCTFSLLILHYRWGVIKSFQGARQLYVHHLRPFLVRHQARLDQIVGCLYGEMVKFVSAHQAEFQFAKTLFTRILVSARDIIHPRQQINGAIEGPRERVETSESEDEE